MRGPAVFLVSLAAVAAVAVLALLPTLKEKRALRPGGEDRSPGEAARRATEAAGKLTASFALPPGEWRGAIPARIDELKRASEAPDPVELTATGGSFRCRWERLPALLANLAAKPLPPLGRLTATPAEDPDWCRVVFRFHDSPGLPEAR